MLVDKSLIIPSESETLVQFIYSSLSNNRDFLFNSTPHYHLILFSHILNDLICRVPVQNASHQPILLLRRQRLGMLTEVSYDNCFQVILDTELAKHPPTIPNYQAKIKVSTLEPGFETCLAN